MKKNCKKLFQNQCNKSIIKTLKYLKLNHLFFLLNVNLNMHEETFKTIFSSVRYYDCSSPGRIQNENIYSKHRFQF